MYIEIATLSVYFVFLIVLGAVFARFNRNSDDYIRGGGKATWWMVGSSSVMANISAFTFTGNAGAAFEGGPTLFAIFFANLLGYGVYALFLAARFRQTRAHTYVDVIEDRFGSAPALFATYASIFLSPLGGAIQLWALSVFTSAVFGFPLHLTIVVVGGMVIIYSTLGGRWAVMATDFAQSVVLFSITILVAFLALRAVGGLGAFWDYFSDPRIADSYRFVKRPDQFDNARFSLEWILVIGSFQFLGFLSLGQSHQFLAVKDGASAKKAAIMGAVLMLVGSVVWLTPPMVARFLYEDEVLGLAIDDPKTAAYAVIAKNLLPHGLMGVMVAAIFSSTMSSLDTGLNGQTGVIVRNLYPKLRQFFSWKSLSGAAEVSICRALTLVLGVIIIGISLLLTKQNQFDLFDAYLVIASIITFPLGFPLIFGLWVRRIPKWGYFFIIGLTLIPSIWSVVDEKLYGNSWTVQDRFLAVGSVALLALLISMPFYRRSALSFRERVDLFFRKMYTPIDFAKEIGAPTDLRQASIMGYTSIAMGLLVALLALVSEGFWGALYVFWISGFCFLVGALLLLGVRFERRRSVEPPTP